MFYFLSVICKIVTLPYKDIREIPESKSEILYHIKLRGQKIQQTSEILQGIDRDG